MISIYKRYGSLHFRFPRLKISFNSKTNDYFRWQAIVNHKYDDSHFYAKSIVELIFRLINNKTG